MGARGGRPQPLTSGPVPHSRPAWSHDGQWIYASGGGGIRKIAAGGGTIVQLTHNGGTNAAESADGKTVYYTNNGAVWRVGTDGSGERQAIDGPASPLTMCPRADGIYYVTPGPNRSIQFFSFATGQSRVIHKLDKPPSLGLSVSPDGAWLLYTQMDRQATADLLLVDPFR